MKVKSQKLFITVQNESELNKLHPSCPNPIKINMKLKTNEISAIALKNLDQKFSTLIGI